MRVFDGSMNSAMLKRFLFACGFHDLLSTATLLEYIHVHIIP